MWLEAHGIFVLPTNLMALLLAMDEAWAGKQCASPIRGRSEVSTKVLLVIVAREKPSSTAVRADRKSDYFTIRIKWCRKINVSSIES